MGNEKCYEELPQNDAVNNSTAESIPSFDNVEYIKGTLGLSDVDTFTFSRANEEELIQFKVLDEAGNDCAASDPVIELTRMETLDGKVTPVSLGKGNRNVVGECATLSAYLQWSEGVNLSIRRGDPTSEADTLDYTIKIVRIDPVTCTGDKFAFINANKSPAYCKDLIGVGKTKSYAITAEATKSIRVEIIEGNQSTFENVWHRCETNDWDYRLFLSTDLNLDPTKTILDDDDSGRGDCPLINGLGPKPLHPRASNVPSNSYIHVEHESGDLGSEFIIIVESY